MEEIMNPHQTLLAIAYETKELKRMQARSEELSGAGGTPVGWQDGKVKRLWYQLQAQINIEAEAELALEREANPNEKQSLARKDNR